MIRSACWRVNPAKKCQDRGNDRNKFEVYTPATTPLRKIEAIGDTAEECIRQFVERGLDPLQYEFVLLPPPYPG